MIGKWYDKSAEQTEALLKTNSLTGLKAEEVKKRRSLDGDNNIYDFKKKSLFEYVKTISFDYLTVLMIITLLLASVFQEAEKFIVMWIILIFYYIIMIFSYVKSRKILEDMSAYALPNAKVLRSGKMLMVKQKQLVRGDIIYVSSGDIVPCDARLLESDGLEVLEVNLTGVTHATRKDEKFTDYRDIAPAQQKNMIFASTIVTRGTGKAICCETGKDTLVFALKKNKTNVFSNDKLKIFDRIRSYCKMCSILMTVLILCLTVFEFFINKNGLFESYMKGLSLAVASMSELYICFAFIALACGIFTAINKKGDINTGALVKNIEKLEKIKELTCLIVPKEAAFGMRDTKINKVYANGDVYSVGEHGFKRNASQVLRYALLSTGIYGFGKLIDNNQRRENVYSSEEEAVIRAAEYCNEFNIELDKKYPLVDHIARGIDNRFETSLVRYENRYVVAIRGDYNSIISLCSSYTEDSRIYDMTPKKMDELIFEAGRLSKESYKVVAVASKTTSCENLKRLSDFQCDMNFEGLLAFKESLLPEAAKNVERCKNAGIKVIMLCFDINKNDASIAENLGISDDGSQVISGEELSRLRETELRSKLDFYKVYQGLNLAQKRLIVRFLQESGEKVGYLCSSLDEIILMKEADVGYAESMTLSDKASKAGITLSGKNIPICTKIANQNTTHGCEALKYVSDVIVSEPDKSGNGGFNAVVDSIVCSKSVYYNVLRMVKYMLSSQLSRILLIIIASFLNIDALTASQILFCGLVIDFLALMIIAFENTGTAILKMPSDISDEILNPIIKNVYSILMGVLWTVITLLALTVMKQNGVIEASQMSTCCFISMIISQMTVLSISKRECSIFKINTRINGAYLSMLVLSVCFLFLLLFNNTVGEWFSVTHISLLAWIGIIVPSLVLLIYSELYKFMAFEKTKTKDNINQNI